MSDGPHKSLNLPPGWKKLAKRADNMAYAPGEVCDALPEALRQDWSAEVPDRVMRKVRDILDSQDSLFGDQRERLEALRGETAGYNLANSLLDYAIHEIDQERSGPEVLIKAVSASLSDRGARGARQVEEHYCRKSTHSRASQVRERIESGLTQSDLAAIAEGLVGSVHGRGLQGLSKQTGLDDGVQL